MKNLYKLIAITALVAVIGFSFIACDGGGGGGNGGGGHVHTFQWVTTKDPTETENGTEIEKCTADNITGSTRTLWATGTDGLAFDPISINDGTDNAYRVHDGGNKTFTAVHIPAFHRPDADSPYVPVTEIGNGTNTSASNAFGGNGSSGTTPATTTPSNPNTTLATVTFAEESQLTAIGNYAFFGCTGLDSITLPASVTSIGSSAFLGCTSLASITIPAGVTSIGQLAFNKCTSLASVTIPAGVTTIDIFAFYGCTSLTSITIPDSVQTISTSAFQDCSSLKYVIIGAGVTSIGYAAFFQCTNLASVTFAGTIPSSGFYDHGSYPNYTVFQGDLRAKFYATDSANGTPGTYTTTAPVSSTSVWTKQ